MEGRKFGNLVVIKRSKVIRKKGELCWICECSCGSICYVIKSKLISGHTKSCGCLKHRTYKNNPKFIDLTGRKFGNLRVLEYSKDKSKSNSHIWKCKCDCGKITYVNRCHLRSGHTKSCGCLKKPHGLYNDPFHGFWYRLRQRCNNINHDSYKNYGGRGITYDLRWENFLEFKKDMFKEYLRCKLKYKFENLTIERKNVDKNYCKENCTFIPMRLQHLNRRSRLRKKG